MVVLPEPLTSQVLLGVPGLLFSQAIGLAMGAQGSAAASGPKKIGTIATTSSTVTAAEIRILAAETKLMSIRPYAARDARQCSSMRECHRSARLAKPAQKDTAGKRSPRRPERHGSARVPRTDHRTAVKQEFGTSNSRP